MNKQTLEEEKPVEELSKLEILEKGLSDAQLSEKLGRINFWRNQKKIKEQREKLLTRMAKSQQGRVMKPKPIRRPNKFATVVSIAGEPVEESADDFKYFD